MKIVLRGRVLSTFEGKQGNTYVTMLDTEAGGQVKLTFEGQVKMPIDQLVDLNATVEPQIGKYGLSLTVKEIFKSPENPSK